jgi:imidazolonepropionase-like amidohydrolase
MKARECMRTIIRNGQVFDTPSLDFSSDRPIAIEDGRIVEYEGDEPGDLEVDASGGFVMPGFVDAHVHFRLTTLDFRKLSQWTEVEFGIAMARLARETVGRGFTAVRDTGGDLRGLMRAISSGAVVGPRIVQSGLMISQTGGHGDVEGGARAVPDCACQMRHTALGIVADGADAVRKAARHLLRDGSDFLKIHVSGGVASPSDPLDCVQYTLDEVRAAVQEAKHRRTYVAAHAYLPESIQMAIEGGVHTIEHGNLIDEPTARLMVSNDAVLVPTLVTYEAMQDVGAALGLPAANQAKNEIVFEAGLRSLELASAAGIEIGFGTDLIGETQPRQNREFAIRAEVQPARDILNSMYVVNPRLMGLEGEIGTLAPGARGDVVVSRRNPLEEIVALSESEKTLSHVILGGVLVRTAAG